MFMSEKIRKGMSEGSWIRRMFDEGNTMKKRYGADKVFDLTLGNPVVEPPAEFVRELKKLAENPAPGMHRYMENAGYFDTRAAVAAQLTKETNLKLTAGDIVMTVGAAGAINVVLKTLLNAGEEVIIFAPYFVEYLNYVDNHGGVVKIVPTNEQFLPQTEVLEKAIGKKTRAVIINSPNNPTGVVYSEKLMRQIGEVLRKKEAQYGTGIYLISDEPYRKLIYDGLKYPSPLLFHHRAIVATSHSKDLALPGERIGYIAIHPECPQKQELMDGFIYCNRRVKPGPSSVTWPRSPYGETVTARDISVHRKSACDQLIANEIIPVPYCASFLRKPRRFAASVFRSEPHRYDSSGNR